MKKQIILLSFMALSFLAITSTQALAVDTVPLTTAATGSSSALVRPNLTAKETNLRTRADTEIQRRLTALQELLTKIGMLKHVPDANKTTYITQIQTEIASLTTLKTKIDAETNAAALKTEVQSIVTSYRVFALFMPQIRLLTAADSVSTVTDNLTTITGKLQTRISTLKASGKDTTTQEALLSDMQAKITDAKTLATAIIAEVGPLTPEGYPGNKTTLEDARKKLQSARQDLETAAQDARKIIQALIAGMGGSPNASDTAGLKMGTNSGIMKPIKTLYKPTTNTGTGTTTQ